MFFFCFKLKSIDVTFFIYLYFSNSPPPPPPPSPPPPLPPPPPAPGVNFPSYAPGKHTSPNLVPNSFLQLRIKKIGSSRSYPPMRSRMRGSLRKQQKSTMHSLIQLNEQVHGDGKGMMTFQYYDANNPPPWLQPPWNAQQPGSQQPAPFAPGSNMPNPSFTQGSAPQGAAPSMTVPLEYNPAALRAGPPL